MLPLVLKPMLAQKAEAPFDSEQHLFEIKWDGIRCLAFVDAGRVRLQSRRLTEITYQFPELACLDRWTTIKALAQPCQICRRTTQKAWSAGRSAGRERFCLKTASCWRRARFSTINSSRDRNNTLARATVRFRARRIIQRGLRAGYDQTSQTPFSTGPKVHEISHYRILSRDRGKSNLTTY